jgi:hypothetical protein
MANKKQQPEMTPEREQEIIAHMDAMKIIDEHNLAIEPYTGNMPYDKARLIAECHFFLIHEAASKYEIGKRLLILKDKEAVQTFAQLLEDEFGGMGRSAAYNYMAFAKKCTELAKVKQFGEKNWSKVLVLMNSCTDEQLKEIEDKGIMGNVLDEFDGMGVRDFKRLLKKYKDDFNKTLKVETHALKVELDAAIKELKDTRMLLPKEEDIEWQLEQFKHVQKLADSFVIACRKFIFDKRMKADENRHIAGAIDKVIIETLKDMKALAKDWHQLTEVDE